MSVRITRAQLLRACAVGVAAAAIAPPALADEVKLFKVVSTKDEITVGVTAGDLGAPPALGAFADAFRKAGKIEVWRYASKKDTNGDLVQAPALRVVLVWSDTLRIEPFASPLKVVMP